MGRLSRKIFFCYGKIFLWSFCIEEKNSHRDPAKITRHRQKLPYVPEEYSARSVQNIPRKRHFSQKSIKIHPKPTFYRHFSQKL